MLINESYDIAVCGGGFGGISAALAAAREDKKVVLFEKEYMLGGLGTAGLVTIYLPLCDGYGHQVSFGISEELLRLSVKYGAEADYPANWLDGIGTRTEKDQRFRVRYNAQLFAILAEKLLISEGVDIMYGSYAIDAEVENEKIKCLHVVNKSGKTKYYVKGVVDATGDCDIAHFAGAPTDTYEEGNVLAAWYYFADKNGYDLKMQGASDLTEEELKRLKEGKESRALSHRRFTGLDGKEISEMVCLSHDKIFENWLSKKEKDETACIATIATIPQLRKTRKLVGEYALAYDEMHKYFEDSVGMVSNWMKRGPIYEVPFRTLYSKEIKNLAVAGRCTSTDQPLWEIMRVIPCCAVTGEAAGTAIAMSDDLTTLDVKKLQEKLVKNGVVLHEKDINI